jgi:hypothetical protein
MNKQNCRVKKKSKFFLVWQTECSGSQLFSQGSGFQEVGIGEGSDSGGYGGVPIIWVVNWAW